MPELLTGVPVALSPLVRRVLAPNAGLMTGPGTNTYLVGVDEVAVVDPGPDDDAHLDAIVGCAGDRIRWVICTHTHPDHSPGAAALARRTGAEVVAFTSRDGLVVDRALADGDQVLATEFQLTALHTPGHASNHVCFLLEQEQLLLSGDHVLAGSTTVIKPLDGDMGAYLAQLERLADLRLRAIAPGHGDLLTDPQAVLRGYIRHRLAREAKVLAAVRAARRATVDDLVPDVYDDVGAALYPLAAFSLWAHLRKLAEEGAVTADAPDDVATTWFA